MDHQQRLGEAGFLSLTGRGGGVGVVKFVGGGGGVKKIFERRRREFDCKKIAPDKK